MEEEKEELLDGQKKLYSLLSFFEHLVKPNYHLQGFADHFLKYDMAVCRPQFEEIERRNTSSN